MTDAAQAAFVAAQGDPEGSGPKISLRACLSRPFVRTSPDRGPAVDIVGRGIARPDGLIAALRPAARVGARSPAS